MILTASCPEGLLHQGNHLAMALGESAADGLTYALRGSERDGVGYALVSFPARPEWIAGAMLPLQRPAWDVDRAIDMAAAAEAQAALVLWTPDAETPPPLARPDRLTVIGGMEERAALAAMGLVMVEGDHA